VPDFRASIKAAEKSREQPGSEPCAKMMIA
jgi:hypothetical protein